MCKGGGSKRGFLHNLSSSSVRDPKELHISSHVSLPISSKVSTPWRALSLSSIVVALLLCAPSSSYVTMSLISKGDLTSSSSSLFPLLMVSSLYALLLMSHLFDDLSSFVLLSGT